MDTAPRPEGQLPDALAQEWDLSEKGPGLDPASFFAEMGVSFDGRRWMRMASLAEPVSETGLAVAIEPELLQEARANADDVQGAMLRTSFSDRGGVAVLGFAVELPVFDDAGREIVVRTLIDPAADAARAELNVLEQQEHLPIDFMDAETGEHLYRWHMAIDQPTRDLIQRSLFRTFGRTSDPLQWPWAALLSLGIHWRM